MKTPGGTRRGFIKKVAGAAAGILGISVLGPSCKSAGQSGLASEKRGRADGSEKSPKVVIARDPSIWRGDKLRADRVKKLLFRAMREYTGSDNDAAAWSQFFDGSEKVGVKLNCIAGRVLSSTPELAAAIVEGLLLAGVRPGNIVCWDRTVREIRKAGFKPGHNESGAIFTGTDDKAVGYDNQLTISGEVGSLVCRIASSWSDALINVPVLKDHDLAGVSGALKNYFGAIHNPNKLHENGCDPYVADLNKMPFFSEKNRLIIFDATTAQYHAGPAYKPQYAWRFSGVIVAQDPVAADTVAWHLIEKKRKAEGKPTLEAEDRPPKYIASAAHPSRALGENRLEKINIVEI